MAEYVGRARVKMDERFLDQLRDVAAETRDIVSRLKHLSPSTKEELLSDDTTVARQAASQLMSTYFGPE